MTQRIRVQVLTYKKILGSIVQSQVSETLVGWITDEELAELKKKLKASSP